MTLDKSLDFLVPLSNQLENWVTKTGYPRKPDAALELRLSWQTNDKDHQYPRTKVDSLTQYETNERSTCIPEILKWSFILDSATDSIK